MLEEHEHVRLVEKWLYEGLSPDEEGQLPPELLARARAHIRNLVDAGIRDRDAGHLSDGHDAMERVSQKLRARIKSA